MKNSLTEYGLVRLTEGQLWPVSTIQLHTTCTTCISENMSP